MNVHANLGLARMSLRFAPTPQIMKEQLAEKIMGQLATRHAELAQHLNQRHAEVSFGEARQANKQGNHFII